LGSPLMNLRAQRTAIINALYLDLEVPRWSDGGQPGVWIRYKPAKFTLTLMAAERRKESKDPEWLELANADVLVDACVGVYTKVDGNAYTVNSDGQWVQFDPDQAVPSDWVPVTGEGGTRLAEAFGIQTNTAVGIMRGLFYSGGDMMAHSGRLNEFSARVMPEADKQFLGE
jgi:hypothetical protein